MPLKLTTYYRGKDIPDLPGNNTFHSKELFQIYESTPGYTPLLIVATEEGRPVARLLAAIRKTKKWLPSSLVKQCVVYGAGEFLNNSLPASKEKEEEIFGEMLEHLTQEASRTCILIEFRNLDNSSSAIVFFGRTTFSRSTGCVSAILCTVHRKQKIVSARLVSGKSKRDSKTERK